MKVTIFSKCFIAFSFLCAIALAIAPTHALAGTGGTEFDPVWQTVQDWSQGTLGRIIACSMIVVGLVMGVARQNIMSFAIGTAAGMGLYNAPTVIQSVMTATLADMHHAPQVTSYASPDHMALLLLMGVSGALAVAMIARTVLRTVFRTVWAHLGFLAAVPASV